MISFSLELGTAHNIEQGLVLGEAAKNWVFRRKDAPSGIASIETGPNERK